MLINDTFATTFLDRETVPKSNLDIANRVRTSLLPWAGQFSPQLVEELLSAYGQRAGVVMDPFVGSGTSLVEAARLGMSAWGSDINAAPVILARLYSLVNMSMEDREAALDSLGSRLSKAVGSGNGPLFEEHGAKESSRAEQESALTELWEESSPGVARILAAALVVLCDFHRHDLNADKIHKTWLRLAKTVRAIPVSTESVVVHQADARALPAEADSVDMVLTSPPYINVRNK